jgi:hypothetical protein
MNMEDVPSGRDRDDSPLHIAMASPRTLQPAISLAQIREGDISLQDPDRIEFLPPRSSLTGNDGARSRSVSVTFSDHSRTSSMGKDSDFRHVSGHSMFYGESSRQSSLGYSYFEKSAPDARRHQSSISLGARSLGAHSIAQSNDTRKSSIGADSHDYRHASGASMISTHQLITVDDPSQRAINHTDRLWTPRSLRVPTLVAISVLFAIFIISVEILALFSRRNNGYPMPSLPPLWTYIPVAIVFIQAAFWAQMEYRTKSLAPWRVLATGPSSASQSLLLDYVSPWNITSFIGSVASRHYAVSLAVLGSLILKLLIICTTGLLAPESSITVRNTSLGLATGFGRGTIDLSTVTANDALMGIANDRGQFQEAGINGSWAYQSLKPLDPSRGT